MDRRLMKSKNIFASKTFWLNVLGVGQLVSGVIPLDPAVTGLIMAGLNVGNRFLTKDSVHVMPQG